MAYSSIAELPSQVKMSLSDEDQEFWKDAYNSRNPQNDDEARDARTYAWMQCKDRPSSFSFSAVASVEDWDVDNEIISVDDLIKSMDRYLDSGGPMSFNHQNYSVACCWGYEPFTKDGMKGLKIWGNVFGGDDGVYDEVRKRFVKGANSVSVAGESKGSHYECNNKGCGFKRGVSELMEIAITPKPANKHAVTLSYNEKAAKNFAKSDDGSVRFTFSEIEIHKSEMECPILKLRKALREAGIDAHAREDGVFVPFVKSQAELRGMGLNATYVDGGMLLNEDDTVRRLFMEGFEKGSVDENGVLSEQDVEFFAKACSAGAVERSNGTYRLIDPLEAFEKANKAVELMGKEEGQKYLDETQPHQTGLHVNNIRNVDRPNEGLDEDRFDPEKFDLVRTEDDPIKPKGGYYESTLLPNKPKGRQSDAMMNYSGSFNDISDKKSLVTELYPDAKVLHIRRPKDWEALFNRFEPSYKTYQGNDLKERYIPFQDLIRDYDAIQFDTFPNEDLDTHIMNEHGNPDSFFDEDGYDRAKKEARQRAGVDERWYDDVNHTIYPYRGRSNYRLVLNPYAVMSSSLHSAGTDFRNISPRSTDWAPFDREESLRRLKERYDKAGIPVNWSAPIAKANKATELLGSEGVRLQDETQPPQKGLHMNYGITDTEDAPKLDHFDPEAFQLFHDHEGSPGYPEGGYYEGVLMPNKPKGRHTDAQNEYGDGGKYSDKGKGIITELYPNANVLHIRNMKDWEDLYDRFDTKISDFEYNNDKGKRYIPSQNLVRDYDAIQFDLWPNKEHNEYIDKNQLYDERDSLEEKRLEHPNFWDREMHRDDIIYPRTSRANERIIINPYAVMNSYPYDPEKVKYESPRTEGYADWDRAKSLEKLRARYEAAGIPVNWEQPIQKSKKFEAEGVDKPFESPESAAEHGVNPLDDLDGSKRRAEQERKDAEQKKWQHNQEVEDTIRSLLKEYDSYHKESDYFNELNEMESSGDDSPMPEPSKSPYNLSAYDPYIQKVMDDFGPLSPEDQENFRKWLLEKGHIPPL